MVDNTSLQILEKDTNEVLNELICEQSSDKVKELTKLFNATQAKKSAVRVLKYNELLDSISNQIAERLDKRSNTFTNKELIEYLQAIHKGIELSEKSVAKVEEMPLIQINKTEVTVNNPILELDRESRDKIDAAVEAYLALAKLKEQQIIEVEEVEVIDESEQNQ